MPSPERLQLGQYYHITWPYSSYHSLLSEKPTRLKRDEVLTWFDGPPAFQAFHHLELNEALIAPLVADDFT